MLLEFSVKNFLSITDWQIFSMLSEKKVKEHQDVVIDKNGYHLLRSAVIYGRNASGKSNFLRAFQALQYLVVESAQYTVDSKIDPYEPNKLNLEYANQPVEFAIDFIAKDAIRYKYEVGFNHQKILYERLRFYPKSQPANLFSRIAGKEIKFGDYLTGRKREIEDLLYENQLFLSKVGTEKIEQLIPPYSFFSDFIFTSIVHDTRYDNALVRWISKKMGEGNIPSYNENINRLVKIADTGIHSLSIKEVEINLIDLPDSLDDQAKRKIVEDNKYRIRTIHKIYQNKEEIGEIEFQLHEESTGTKKLLIVGSLIIEALEDGQVLIIDELDKSLHPKLTRELIKIFHDPVKNPNNAQLIFATHDVNLLDNELFRRDQIWFSEKELDGSSYYYALSDIQGVRHNIPFEKWYMSGRFGGTPVINDQELMFQLK